MKHANPIVHFGLILVISFALIFAAGAKNAQSQATSPTTPPAATSPTTAPVATTQDRDDVTRRQLAGFDEFLDAHPETSEQLRKDPSLVNNRELWKTILHCSSTCSSTRRSGKRSARIQMDSCIKSSVSTVAKIELEIGM